MFLLFFYELLRSMFLSQKRILTPVIFLAGCEVIGEEIEDFHAQGEAMAITFPILEANIWYRELPEDNSTMFQLFHSKNHDLSKQAHRVVQQGRTLWLLPSLSSDSGTYTYVFR